MLLILAWLIIAVVVFMVIRTCVEDEIVRSLIFFLIGIFAFSWAIIYVVYHYEKTHSESVPAVTNLVEEPH